VIVTTPEKWDVITRKSSTQQSLLSQVKLLIIDEVHLLADERGPVIETIVARTLRRVESTQSMIRIVGLSATLPNYADVASFLRVYVPDGDARMQNAATNGGKGGLFFDATYRPVPLDQTFIGVSTNANLKEALGLSAAALTTVTQTDADLAKEKKAGAAMSRQRQIQLMMNKLTLAHCLKQVQHNEQVMVFVHSRKETAGTMHGIVELARSNEEEPGTLEAFLPPAELQMPIDLQDRFQKSRNKELKELLGCGMGIHHAGMLRSDRNLTDQLSSWATSAGSAALRRWPGVSICVPTRSSSRALRSTFTLISDTNYVAQNGSRVCRAVSDISLKKNSARKADKFLQLAKCIDQKLWFGQNAKVKKSVQSVPFIDMTACTRSRSAAT
jgi:activating signal cointegrator complex subunit 3